MSDQAEREDLVLLGRTIGTYEGWDGDPGETMIFYAFKPCDVLLQELPEGDLNVEYDKGTFSYYDDEKLYKSFDMLATLQMVQRDPPKEPR